MKLIDGDKIVTAQLYDDEHEEFTEKKMSIIDCINAYTDEGVTVADDVLDKIRAEIEKEIIPENSDQYDYEAKWQNLGLRMALSVIDWYKAESEDKE